jgi:hypothetical protein
MPKGHPKPAEHAGEVYTPEELRLIIDNYLTVYEGEKLKPIDKNFITEKAKKIVNHVPELHGRQASGVADCISNMISDYDEYGYREGTARRLSPANASSPSFDRELKGSLGERERDFIIKAWKSRAEKAHRYVDKKNTDQTTWSTEWFIENMVYILNVPREYIHRVLQTSKEIHIPIKPTEKKVLVEWLKKHG